MTDEKADTGMLACEADFDAHDLVADEDLDDLVLTAGAGDDAAAKQARRGEYKALFPDG